MTRHQQHPPTRPRRAGHRRPRRGVTSVMAMMFLVLFAALATGFYVATTTANEVSQVESRIHKSLFAAESGMDMIRYHLANVSIPAGTPNDDVLFELYADLKAALENSGNLGVKKVGLFGNVIRIPANTSQWISLDPSNGQEFRATITDTNGQLVVKVVGRHTSGPVFRAIQMEYKRQEIPNSLFNYALAARGKIKITKGELTGINTPTIADVMSAATTANAIDMSGGTIGGNLIHVPGATVNVSNGSVHGSTSLSEIYSKYVLETETPDFPVIDTDAYRHYATNSFNPNAQTLTNVRIPAGANPTFPGNMVIQGILYIESPNTINFRGNVALNGFLVVDNDAASKIDFRGDVVQGALPSGTQFDPFRTITFAAVLAPTAAVTISGSTKSLFNGNLLMSTFNWDGAGAVTIDQGTLVALGQDPVTGVSATLNGSKAIKITGTGKDKQPTIGFSYTTSFKAIAGTYQELLP
jgi:hypothetical protein